MILRIAFGLLFSIILMAGCTSAPRPAPGGDTPVPGYPAPTGAATPPAYPVPWEPQPEDENMKRADVMVDQHEILILESFPPQYRLHLVGSLPTPCHELRVVVGTPDNQNRIDVEVYSLVDPNRACIQVIKPFDVSVELGSYSAGHFTVWLNGEQIGEIAP